MHSNHSSQRDCTHGRKTLLFFIKRAAQVSWWHGNLLSDVTALRRRSGKKWRNLTLVSNPPTSTPASRHRQPQCVARMTECFHIVIKIGNTHTHTEIYRTSNDSLLSSVVYTIGLDKRLFFSGTICPNVHFVDTQKNKASLWKWLDYRQPWLNLDYLFPFFRDRVFYFIFIRLSGVWRTGDGSLRATVIGRQRALDCFCIFRKKEEEGEIYIFMYRIWKKEKLSLSLIQFFASCFVKFEAVTRSRHRI